jgi:hypothetical protein
MISSNTVLLLLVLGIIVVLLVVILLSIALVKQYTKKKQRLIRRRTAAKRKSGQTENASPVFTEVDGPKVVDSPKNELVASHPSVASSKSAVKPKRASTNIDEEHKYTQPRTDPPDWFVPGGIRMIIPYYLDTTKGVDLRGFPGTCKVYVDRRHSWTSNITDLMSAQALWHTAQKYQDIAIEPERPCELVTLAKDELSLVNKLTDSPYTVAKRWEDRELIGKYRCLATDRQHLVEVKTYRVTKYENRQLIDATTGSSHEETVPIDSHEERLIEQCPY